jgi:hypothetical protein
MSAEAVVPAASGASAAAAAVPAAGVDGGGGGGGAGGGKAERLYVCIRARPLNARELAGNSTEAWRVDEKGRNVSAVNSKDSGGTNQTFPFGNERTA